MKKVILTIAIALITLTSFTSCSDNSYDEDLLNKTQLALQGMYDQYTRRTERGPYNVSK